MSTRTRQTVASGASLNATARQHTSFSADKGGANVKGTGISFTSPGTIADSGNGLGALRVGARIRVAGSPKNSRVWRVATSSAGSITVTPSQVTSEAAGAAITITAED
ncbi:MAG: hypothetical protein NTY94_17130 [Alphaproteobacteria bacterium]|nr:hypothetical protein [Alphaproteobacteria bacterium]